MYFSPATKLDSRIGYPAGLAGNPTFRRFQPERSSGIQLIDPLLNAISRHEHRRRGLDGEWTPLAHVFKFIPTPLSVAPRSSLFTDVWT